MSESALDRDIEPIFLIIYSPMCPQCDDETVTDDGKSFTCAGCELYWPNTWSPAEWIPR